MKAGIVGAGAMGKVHIKALQQISEINSITICDISEEALQKVREDFPEVVTYTDLDEMLATGLDILSVVTTGPSHAMLVQKTAGKVKRIFCEKPIATNIKDAEAMRDAVRNAGGLLVINHSRRWSEFYVDLAEKLATGIIGDVKTFHLVIGGGRLGCIGTHFFDLLHMLTGKKSLAVTGKIDKRYAGDHKGRNIFDPGGYLLVELEGHVKAFIDISEDLGIPPQIMITGSMGYLTINEPYQVCEVFSRSKEDKKRRLGEYGLPLHKQVLEMEKIDILELTKKGLQELVLHDKIGCSADDGIRSIEIVLGTHISDAKGNTKITLPFVNSEDKEFNVRIT